MEENTKKKLSKKKRRNGGRLFVEQVSIPVLILATSVLFTVMSLGGGGYTKWQMVSMALAAAAIPMLSISIFARKVVAILDPKKIDMPNLAEESETIGFALGVTSFVFTLWSIAWWICLAGVISGILGGCMNHRYLMDARNGD